MAMRKPVGNKQTEWFIKKQVRKILTDTRWSFWMPSADIYGRNGVSDFLAVKSYKLFMAIETKYKNVPTQPQLEFLRMVHDAGHYAFLVDETNVEILQHVLWYQLDHGFHSCEPLMKWKVINHADTSTDEEHRSEAARSITSAVDTSWTEPLNRRR